MTRTSEDNAAPSIEEATGLLAAALSGTATLADIELAVAWRNRSDGHERAFRDAVKGWELTRLAAIRFAAAGQLPPHRKVAADRIGRRALVFGGMTAVAASGALLAWPPLGLWTSMFDLTADYHTAAGTRETIALPGGGAVELNTRTSIDRRIDGGEDLIRLIAGEAAISCGDSRPVIVAIAQGRAVCTGGTLNVRRDGARARITCIEGEAVVECGPGRVPLGAGEQVSYRDRTLGAVSRVDLAETALWRKGILLFRNEPLADVLREANRYRPGRIVLLNAGLGERRITLRIEIARIEEIFSIVQAASGASVTALPGGVVIVS